MSLPQDGVNANALAETTTIPTGKKLIFLDPDTNEGGIITLENLTKQILSNLATQTFNLDQGTKTLLAALNELNSNRSVSILREVPGGDKILFFYTGSSSLVLNEKGSKIPSWSFCIYLPFNANGDGALLVMGSTAFGYAFRSSGTWGDFIEK